MALFSILPHMPRLDDRLGFARRVGVRLAGDAGGRAVDRAAGSRYVRNVAVLAGGTALGQGVVVLASPLLTRLYSPSDFGLLAAYAAILSILMVVSALRYDVAVPLAAEEETAANLMALSLSIVLVSSALSGVVVWLFGGQMARLVGAPELAPYLWLVPISLVAAGVYQVLVSWAIRREAMGAIARTKLSQGLGMVGTQLGLGLLKAGPIGLLGGWAVGQASGSGALASVSWRRDRRAVRHVTRAGIRGALIRYRRLALLSSGSAFVNNLVLGLPALFLASKYGLYVAGEYALGQRVVGVPMLLVGSSMAQVYQGEAFRLARDDPWSLNRLFMRTIKRLLVIGMPPILLLSVTAPWTFQLVFGPEWRNAGIYLAILSPMLVVQFVISQIGATLEVLERQDLYLATSMIRLGLLVGVIVLSPVLVSGGMAAIALLGAASLIGYLVYGLLCWYALVKQRERLSNQRGGDTS